MKTLILTLIALSLTSSVTLFGQSDEPELESMLSIYDLETGEVDTLLTARAHFEAPNWTPDGRQILTAS